jgi:hypothetical protein
MIMRLRLQWQPRRGSWDNVIRDLSTFSTEVGVWLVWNRMRGRMELLNGRWLDG